MSGDRPAPIQNQPSVKLRCHARWLLQSQALLSPQLTAAVSLTSNQRSNLRRKRLSAPAPESAPVSAPVPESAAVSAPAPDQSQEMALATEQSGERAPVPESRPERAPAPTSSPERAPTPGPQRASTPLIPPRIFFWGGGYRAPAVEDGTRPRRLFRHGLLSSLLRHGLLSSLLCHGSPDCLLCLVSRNGYCPGGLPSCKPVPRGLQSAPTPPPL